MHVEGSKTKTEFCFWLFQPKKLQTGDTEEDDSLWKKSWLRIWFLVVNLNLWQEKLKQMSGARMILSVCSKQWWKTKISVSLIILLFNEILLHPQNNYTKLLHDTISHMRYEGFIVLIMITGSSIMQVSKNIWVFSFDGSEMMNKCPTSQSQAQTCV